MGLHTWGRKVPAAFIILTGVYSQNSFALSPCEQRLDFIQSGLNEAREETHAWIRDWGITWSVAAGAQLAVAATTHQVATREDLFAGAFSSSLGLIPTWIFPPAVSDEKTSFLRCDQLSELEARLDQDAISDDKMTGALAHVSNIVVNLAVSATLGLGFGHWNSAWISAAAGIPVGEWMILTYPRAASHLKERSSRNQSLLDYSHFAWIPAPNSQTLLLSLDF